MHLTTRSCALRATSSLARRGAGSRSILARCRLARSPRRLSLCRPTLTGPRSITLTDRVSHAHAKLVWPTVPANHPDEAALDVLASILGGSSKWNRLFRALSYDRQIATQVERVASHVSAGGHLRSRPGCADRAANSTSWSISLMPKSIVSRKRAQPPTKSAESSSSEEGIKSRSSSP